MKLFAKAAAIEEKISASYNESERRKEERESEAAAAKSNSNLAVNQYRQWRNGWQ